MKMELDLTEIMVGWIDDEDLATVIYGALRDEIVKYVRKEVRAQLQAQNKMISEAIAHKIALIDYTKVFDEIEDDYRR